MMKGSTIILKGISNHGKNRIREHGDKWEVLGLPSGVISTNPKPTRLCIKSVKTGEERWLDKNDIVIENVKLKGHLEWACENR